MTCPTPDQWAEFVVSPTDSALEHHLSSCPACRRTLATFTALTERLRSDDVGIASTVSVDEVVAHAVRPRRAVTPLLALAASVALVVGGAVARHDWREDTMTPRGEAPAWRDRVTARLVSTSMGLIEPGAKLPRNTRFTVAAFGVLGTDRLAVLAYVEDAKGVLHWVAPAWLEEAYVPPTPWLSADGGFRTTPEHVLSMESSMAFDDLATGPGSVVTLVLEEPVSLLTIERLGRKDLESLRARFPGSLVRAIPIDVQPEGASGPYGQ